MARPATFTTVTTQGGLLPTDLLALIAANGRGLPGLEPADYRLNPGERLGEMINRAWNRVVGAWAAFQDALAGLPEGDPATTVTRERWLLVLLQEVGFGRLAAARSMELNGRSFPISHRWGSVPIHLVGARVDLDRRTPGVTGAARVSPYGLVQEYLNAAPDALWGIVSNGLRLRLLRNNTSLTRQAYVEFDLASLMEGQVYPDFVLLWLLIHPTRFEAENPADCWLERWAREANQRGTRALEHLREAVERAITALGRGFLAHPANAGLLGQLRRGELSTQDYYRLILRLVYRLLFLFVAEDRDLLLDPGATAEARERYRRFYSVDRLRRLSERWRGTRHADLYEGLKVVMGALWEEGLPALGLPALGSFLWSPEAIGVLGSSQIANRDLLEAIEALAFTRQEGIRRQVDYRNLGAEELGSVYESLLELHPRLNLDAASFELATASGHERKTTGSYYTPTEFITSLLETALDPVLNEAARQPDPETAILSLTVLDPACGSGHFLIAAAQRIARRLAAVRSGDPEPAPAEVRRALRDVISRCVHGVDVNPMAVELCKVNLWLEALVPGRPLSFLDHHVQCGNSLLGTTPALLAKGIPDAAYHPITGDDREVAAGLRRRNRQEAAGQVSLLLRRQTTGLPASALVELEQIEALAGRSIAEVREMEERWAQLLASARAGPAKLAADAWCAAFFLPKTKEEPVLTEEVRGLMASDPERVPRAVLDRVATLADEERFFHWHLAFPRVFRVVESPGKEGPGWSGGFDVVLGNPPWERVKLQEQEFFATRSPRIAAAAGARRKRMIEELEEEDPPLHAEYRRALRRSEATSLFLRGSGRFPLCGRGDVNTYAVFAETMRSLLAPTGRAGVIVPTGIATDATTKEFFADLVRRRSLASLYDFENAGPLFPAVDRRYKFCLLTMTGPQRPVREGAEFCFFAHRTEDLREADRRFRLTADDLRLFNPNTETCPIFRSRRDAEITRRIYQRVPVLIDRTRPNGNLWGISFMTMFHMTNDSGLFRTREQLEREGWRLEGNVFRRGAERYLPLYEGKIFHHFDHRFASYEDGRNTRELTSDEKADPRRLPLPRYWVHEREVEKKLDDYAPQWLLGWRKTARSTDVRTMIISPIPRVAVGDKAPLIINRHKSAAPTSVAVSSLASFPLDFAARTKLGSTDFSHFIVEQLPVLPPAAFATPSPWDRTTTVERWIAPRVAELTCTAVDLLPLAAELGFPHAPFRWDDTRRQLLRAELDAAFFHLYGLSREDADYVMDTFPIVRRKDEQAHGEYRTKRLILERYDALAAAIESGVPYRTVLDPPPADPAVAHRSPD